MSYVIRPVRTVEETPYSWLGTLLGQLEGTERALVTDLIGEIQSNVRLSVSYHDDARAYKKDGQRKQSWHSSSMATAYTLAASSLVRLLMSRYEIPDHIFYNFNNEVQTFDLMADEVETL